MPEEWKKAIIYPIFKGGNRGEVKNYTLLFHGRNIPTILWKKNRRGENGTLDKYWSSKVPISPLRFFFHTLVGIFRPWNRSDRGISLLNTAYKIFAMILERRLYKKRKKRGG